VSRSAFWANLVAPRLFVGACPESPADVEHLKQELDATTVLTLQTDADRRLYRLDWPGLLRAYEREGIELVELPILDRDEEDLARRLPQAVHVLDELLHRGDQVLVHCNIGNGRSPTVVAAWLHWKQDWDVDAAVEHVHGCRDSQPNPEIIRRACDQPRDGSR
jgi:protein-tyrosine phosphatase